MSVVCYVEQAVGVGIPPFLHTQFLKIFPLASHQIICRYLPSHGSHQSGRFHLSWCLRPNSQLSVGTWQREPLNQRWPLPSRKDPAVRRVSLPVSSCPAIWTVRHSAESSPARVTTWRTRLPCCRLAGVMSSARLPELREKWCPQRYFEHYFSQNPLINKHGNAESRPFQSLHLICIWSFISCHLMVESAKAGLVTILKERLEGDLWKRLGMWVGFSPGLIPIAWAYSFV